MKISSGFLSLLGLIGAAGGLLGAVPVAAAHDLTFDVSKYSYEETNYDKFFMSDESKPLFADIGLRHWDRPDTDYSFGYMYTGELTAGRTHYDSQGSGTGTKMYYKGRAEGYVSFRVNEFLTPFVGLGYRLLYDASGNHHPSNGGEFYDRKSHYVYLPIGVRIDPMDKLFFKLQFNQLLHGRQKSYLSDTNNDYPDILNGQDQGWGMDATANYNVWNDWSVYGFFRYWDIGKSSTRSGAYNGGTVVNWYEPNNHTQEYGIGVAYHF